MEVGEGQLGGLHAPTQRRHRHHFPAMVAQFGHVLLCFAQRLVVLLHLHSHSEIKNLQEVKSKGFRHKSTLCGQIQTQNHCAHTFNDRNVISESNGTLTS